MEPNYTALAYRNAQIEKYTKELTNLQGDWDDIQITLSEFKDYMSYAQLKIHRKRRVKIGRQIKAIKIKLQLLE